MQLAAMHEHMGEQLPPPEEGRMPVVQREQVVEATVHEVLRDENDDIDDNKIQNYRRHLHATPARIEHTQM
ncbi:hypothetical protein GCM10023093_10760 [Nemorincola caseinilytica]|uniref:Uncharacterized protein n=1 Tax=Nemorincola caseinilytica TaxID=2054315 RepID=A0ABP8N8F1_9BACT